MNITCQSLAARLQAIEPEADVREVARTCLLLCNTLEDLHALENDAALAKAYREMSLKLQVSTDQHAAMTEELEELARSNPEQFSKDQVWVLVRAIKVQSQILQLYVGQPLLDV